MSRFAAPSPVAASGRSSNRALLAVRYLLARGANPNGSGLSPAEMAEFLTPKYPALQEEVKRAAKKSGHKDTP